MEIKEFYSGYFKYNSYLEKLVLLNNEWSLEVDAEHIYDIIKKIDAYDKDGNYLGIFKDEKRETRREKKIIDDQKSVIQINYDFHLMPVGRTVSQDEICSALTILENSELSKFDYGYHLLDLLDRQYSKGEYNSYFSHSKKEEDKIRISDEFSQPFEVSCIGNSYWITNNVGELFLDLNIKEYKKNKENFIKKIKDDYYAHQVETLFEYNIKTIAAIYMTTPNMILNDRFNKANHLIKKLNFKLN